LFVLVVLDNRLIRLYLSGKRRQGSPFLLVTLELREPWQ